MTFDDTNYNPDLGAVEVDSNGKEPGNLLTVSVLGSLIHIDTLDLEIPELAEALIDLSNSEREAYLTSVIMYGTETMRVMQTTATAESLKNVALAISNDIESKKEVLVDSLQNLIDNMTSTESTSGIPFVLKRWRDDFEKALKEEFDSTNTNSIINKFDDLIKEKRSEESSEIAKRLDFNEQNSAVNMLVDKISKVIENEIEEVTTDVARVLEKLGIDAATDDVKGRLTNRGNDFERAVFEIIAPISRLQLDVADDPGQQKAIGFAGNDEGDITVLVNPVESQGDSILFVYECKLRKGGLSDNAAMKELDKGIDNRGAKAGVIITEPRTSQEMNGYNFFREMPNNRAILFIDPNDIDENAIRYSYLWARLKCLDSTGKVLSSKAVKDSLQTIAMAIKKCSELRRNNTSAIKSIEMNGGIVDEIDRLITAEIKALNELIAEVENVIESDAE